MKNAWFKFREYLGFLIVLAVIVSGFLFAIPAFLLLGLGAWISPRETVSIDKRLDNISLKLKAWGEKHGQKI